MLRSDQKTRRVAAHAVGTGGDFPHVRRSSVWLACCTTTTCCLTLLIGAGGGLIGLIIGIAKGVTLPRERSNSPTENLAIGFLQCVGLGIMFGVMGLFIGAGIGFLLDNVPGMF